MLKNKEIAEMLNISPAAVSLALNNKAGVSEETRRKIIAVRNGSMAAEYNDIQQYNINASQILFIVLKKHGGVISETPFFMELSETLHQQAGIEGFNLQVCYTVPHTDLNEYLSSINADLYDGILVLGTEAMSEDIREILKFGKPTVVLDSWFDDVDVDCVLMDNYSGIIQAVKYAFSQGHRKIGYIGSNVHANNFTERFNAYKEAMHGLNLTINEDFIYHIHSSIDGADAEMSALLSNKSEMPTVFICANDLIAMGAMNALISNGYSIPNDVSITGFDDMSVSAHLNPPLTSVGFQARKIARIGVKVLVDRIKDDSMSDCMRYIASTELKIRKSLIPV